MSCRDVMIEDVISVSPDTSVAEAIRIMNDKHIRGMPVVDEKGMPVGVFSLRQLLKSVLPSAVTIEGGLSNIGFYTGADGDIEERMHAAMPKPVSKYMSREFEKVFPDTPFMQGLLMLYSFGSPLPVVDPASGKLVGLISGQSAVASLLEP